MNGMRRLILATVMAALPCVASAQDKLTVRVDWLPWGIHAGLHLAVEKGWFKKAGLDVEVSDGKGSSLTMQQVATGEVDVGQVQLSAMAVAKGKGMPLIAIAGLGRRTDLAALVPAESDITDVKGLEGKKIAYTAASSLGSLAAPFFTSGGLDISKVQMVNVDASSLMSAYVSGSVDAVLTTLPFAKSTADKQRPSRGILFADVGLNLPSYGLITNETVLKEKRDALAKFVPVVVRAWEYIYDGHIDEGVDAVLSQRANEKLDRDIIRGQIVDFEPFFVTEATKGKRFGWQALSDWEEAIAILTQVGLMPKGANASEFFTNEFVQE